MFYFKPKETDPDCSTAGLIHACLFDTNKMNRLESTLFNSHVLFFLGILHVTKR